MSPTLIGVIGVLLLVVLLFSRMPVGFVMGLLGFLGFAWVVNFPAAVSLISQDLYTVFANY
ncbi:MAG: C4-dicarboxylate ABC transporter permease, partial [Deltaproteobacteria bacterium]|nr:C4-dicarboxylate ABC transporter permease [Deltaproteobacteria bacterium]